MCRYQPGQRRTSSWSRPTSVLACWKPSSIARRLPAIRTSPTREVLAGPRQAEGGELAVAAAAHQRLGALDGQHIGHAAVLEPDPQGRVAAVDLIGGHPAVRHPSMLTKGYVDM
jgi:hypothetical protein